MPAADRGGQELLSHEDPAVAALGSALVDGDRETAARLFEEHIEATGSFLATIDGLVQPTMAEIGACWANGDVSVAEEHLATATMETVVAQQLRKLGTDVPEDPGTILLACVEGNRHELGLRVLSDAFELSGWEARFLGADVPVAALVAMVDRWRPDVVALSISLEEQQAAAEAAIAEIRGLGDPQPVVLLGGPLTGDQQPSVEALGADAWAASVAEGMQVARA